MINLSTCREQWLPSKTAHRTCAALTLCAVLMLGCTNGGNNRNLGPDLPSTSEAADVVIFADNQFAELHGAPHNLQTDIIDRYIPVTRRPGALNALSLSTIGTVSRANPDARLLLHLGDALNNGCLTEWQAFERTMNELDREWYLAPGNHDGYYLGISHPVTFKKSRFTKGVLDEQIGWGTVCTPERYRNRGVNFTKEEYERYAFSKADLIINYVDTLSKRSKSWNIIKPASAGGLVCAADLDPTNHIKKLCWQIKDPNKPWDSFIIQEIIVNNVGEAKSQPVSILLIDTTSHREPPTFASKTIFNKIGGAGAEGQITPDQQKQIEMWLEDSNELGYSTLIAGHHPIEALDKKSREWLLTLADAYGLPYYLSAHTHSGDVEEHPTPAKRKITEINIGSLIDAPIEYLKAVFPKDNGDRNQDLRFERVSMTPVDADMNDVAARQEDVTYEDCKRKYYELLFSRINKHSSWDGEWRSQFRSHQQEMQLYKLLFEMIDNDSIDKKYCYRPYDIKCDAGDASDRSVCIDHNNVPELCKLNIVESQGDRQLVKMASLEEVRSSIQHYESRFERYEAYQIHKDETIELARFVDLLEEIESDLAPHQGDQYTSARQCLALIASHELRQD